MPNMLLTMEKANLFCGKTAADEANSNHLILAEMKLPMMDEQYVDPDSWITAAALKEGSWWPEWIAWLDARSGKPLAPPAMGSAMHPPLCDAPGTYVLQQ